jgi:hypothetical protein
MFSSSSSSSSSRGGGDDGRRRGMKDKEANTRKLGACDELKHKGKIGAEENKGGKKTR